MTGAVLLHLTVLAVAWLLILPTTAWAYIDPGTGSYVFQLLIAGGLAALYTLRRYWQNVKSSVARLLGGSRRGAGDTDGLE